jgi:hypothetical protein
MKEKLTKRQLISPFLFIFKLEQTWDKNRREECERSVAVSVDLDGKPRVGWKRSGVTGVLVCQLVTDHHLFVSTVGPDYVNLHDAATEDDESA